MAKTLYITDLDGTLLNKDKEISGFSRAVISKFIAAGGFFSIATARSAASAVKIINGLDIHLPAVLMNGAVIYDFKYGKYIKTEIIPAQSVGFILDMLGEYGVSGFMYAVKDGQLITYYEKLEAQPMKEFYEERVRKYYKAFVQVDYFKNKTHENNIIYFTLIEEYDVLSGIYNSLKNRLDIDTAFYKDNYSENLWYLEIFSVTASKYNAVCFLRDSVGFDKIIGFGDNHNDLPFLKACDDFYAVSNGVDELKVLSTAVIDSNDSDGVAKFLEERMMKQYQEEGKV